MRSKSERKAVLGPRQLEILVHTALGYTYTQTANALNISVHTVRGSLLRIIEKLGATGRVDAVALAWHEGLIDLDSLKESFTLREREAWGSKTILEQLVNLVARGYSNKEIGRLLSISEQQIKNFIFSLSKRVGARNRVHLVVLALFYGLIDLQSLGSEDEMPRNWEGYGEPAVFPECIAYQDQ